MKRLYMAPKPPEKLTGAMHCRDGRFFRIETFDQ